ncbi:SMI1/KNR4 family protein [Kitasatospora sp. NPDC051853]|uniref:SMI1/KNR4 family protein n=1 Tax=Kitasatospora sp. NPDC051853 TaxID=3364058 RepID=UPI0037ADB41F
MEWIGRLVRHRERQAVEDGDYLPGEWPGLRSPCTVGGLAELEARLGIPLESEYRDFLLISDGMEDFSWDGMSVLGAVDWPDSPKVARAIDFRDMIVGGRIDRDLGIPEGVRMAPIGINRDGDAAILLLGGASNWSPRYLWTGSGDSVFFDRLSEVFEWACE